MGIENLLRTLPSTDIDQLDGLYRDITEDEKRKMEDNKKNIIKCPHCGEEIEV